MNRVPRYARELAAVVDISLMNPEESAFSDTVRSRPSAGARGNLVRVIGTQPGASAGRVRGTNHEALGRA